MRGHVDEVGGGVHTHVVAAQRSGHRQGLEHLGCPQVVAPDDDIGILREKPPGLQEDPPTQPGRGSVALHGFQPEAIGGLGPTHIAKSTQPPGAGEGSVGAGRWDGRDGQLVPWGALLVERRRQVTSPPIGPRLVAVVFDGRQRLGEQLGLGGAVTVRHGNRCPKRQRADHTLGVAASSKCCRPLEMCVGLVGVTRPVIEPSQRAEGEGQRGGIVVAGRRRDHLVENVAGLGIGQSDLDGDLGPQPSQLGVGWTGPGRQIDRLLEQGQCAAEVRSHRCGALRCQVPRLWAWRTRVAARPAVVGGGVVGHLEIVNGRLSGRQPSKPVSLEVTKASTASITSLGSRVSIPISVEVDVAPSAEAAVFLLITIFL